MTIFLQRATLSTLNARSILIVTTLMFVVMSWLSTTTAQTSPFKYQIIAALRIDQEKSASKAQMDRVNNKYDEIAKAFTLGAAYDGDSGNLYFGMTTRDDNKAIGYVTPAADVMNLFIVSTTGRTKVLSFSRIAYDADGKQKNVAAATQLQLDKLSQRLIVENGKISSLAGYLNNQGALVFKFMSGVDQKIAGMIAK